MRCVEGWHTGLPLTTGNGKGAAELSRARAATCSTTVVAKTKVTPDTTVRAGAGQAAGIEVTVRNTLDTYLSRHSTMREVPRVSWLRDVLGSR